MGNAVADALADRGRDLAQPRPRSLADVQLGDKICWLACRHLVDILVQCMVHRKGSEQELPEPKPVATRKQLEARSGHIMTKLFGVGSRWVCRQCNMGPGSKHIRTWLQTVPCPGYRPPVPLSGTGLRYQRLHQQEMGRLRRIGRRVIHGSHTVSWFCGGTWCWACGAYSTTQAYLLAHPCRRMLKGAGAQVLKRILRGYTPRTGEPWPRPPAAGELTPQPPMHVQDGLERTGLPCVAQAPLPERTATADFDEQVETDMVHFTLFDSIRGKDPFRLDDEEELEIAMDMHGQGSTLLRPTSQPHDRVVQLTTEQASDRRTRQLEVYMRGWHAHYA